ncbi:MAG TPA: hypothetical protein VNL77_12835 [Roseiflexaceae bacterium]|nr:hypothetical protein [Roseiflexaceae bacterium]
MTELARAQAPARPLPLPRVEHLWTLLPLALCGVFLALVPTTPHDFWWHLRVGQIVAEQGVPRTNLFAWTLPPDAPFVYAAWLSDWLFYLAYLAGGLQGPVLLRNLLGMAGFGLVALEARRRSGSWRLAGLAVLLAGAMAINNLTTRPQNVAWPLFAAYALVLGAYAAGQAGPRALALLPPLMACWVNAHGSFVLGLVLVAGYAFGETLRTLCRRMAAAGWGAAPLPTPNPQPLTSTPRRLAWLYLAGAACLAAVLLNPIGPGIFGYVLKLLTDPPSQTLVNEWQPPTTRSLAGTLFFGALVALVAALALGRRRPTLTDALLVCAFLWLAVGGMRYVVWFGMLAMPLLAQCLGAEPRRATKGHEGSGRSAGRAASPGRWFSALLTLLLVAGVVAVQPPFKAALPLPAAYSSLFAAVPGAPGLFSADTPAGAAAYLRAHPTQGRLFNDMAYGSYLIWAAPGEQVFADPRVELFPLALWQDYLAIAEARGHAELLERYRIERVLLDRRNQPKLAAALAADPAHWTLEYTDGRAEIYRRVSRNA